MKSYLEQFWKAFGAVDAPYSVRLLTEERSEGVCLKRLRMTTHEVKGSAVEAYAVLACPKNCAEEMLPAILHCHGGTQTASEADAIYAAKRGYVALTFDWTGTRAGRENEVVTHWPEPVKTIKDGAVDFYAEGEMLRMQRVAQCVWLTRRMLTFLCDQERVDTARIGLYGISWGGLQAWLVAGLENRLACVAPVYGCGLGIGEPQASGSWCQHFQPEHYAADIEVPVFFLNGTNDFFGHLNTGEAVFAQCSAPKWRYYAANENHCVREGGQALWRWFDWQLKGADAFPEEPVVSVRGRAIEVQASGAQRVTLCYSYEKAGAGGGAEAVIISPDAAGDAEKAHGRYDDFRHWYVCELSASEAGHWKATVEPFGEAAWAYACCDYGKGVQLSSQVIEVPAREMAEPEPLVALIDPGCDRAEEWFTFFEYPGDVGVLPHPQRIVAEAGWFRVLPVHEAQTSNYEPGILFRGATRRLGCPRCAPHLRKARGVSVVLDASEEVLLRVSLFYDNSPMLNGASFFAEQRVNPGRHTFLWDAFRPENTDRTLAEVMARLHTLQVKVTGPEAASAAVGAVCLV